MTLQFGSLIFIQVHLLESFLSPRWPDGSGNIRIEHRTLGPCIETSHGRQIRANGKWRELLLDHITLEWHNNLSDHIPSFSKTQRLPPALQESSKLRWNGMVTELQVELVPHHCSEVRMLEIMSCHLTEDRPHIPFCRLESRYDKTKINFKKD